MSFFLSLLMVLSPSIRHDVHTAQKHCAVVWVEVKAHNPPEVLGRNCHA